MTRRNKLIVLVAYLLILSAVMLTYRINRAKKVKQLRIQIAEVYAQQEKLRKGEAELSRLSKLIPAEANVTATVESLYRFATLSALNHHEIATEANKQQATARPGRGQNEAAVSNDRIKVSIAGTFRQIAEYIRQVQNMERFNRITEIKLAPDAGQVKGTLTIEFFSLPVKP